MVCQQSVGINGIGFYTAETFVAAGKWTHADFGKKNQNKPLPSDVFNPLQFDLLDFLQEILEP